MISFKQFIAEIFNDDSHLKWVKEGESAHHRTYSFYDESDNRYTLTIDQLKQSNKTAFVVSFVGPKDVAPTRINRLPGALKIYNTVIGIVRHDISSRIQRGDVIRFVYVVKKTQQIYQRFAKMIAKEIGGTVELDPDKHTIKVTKR